MIATATIIGKLDKDPEIRYSRQGVAQTTLKLHAAEGSIFEVIAHGAMAENIVLSVTRGMEISVYGHLVQTNDTDRAQINAIDVSVSLRHATADVHHVSRVRS